MNDERISPARRSSQKRVRILIGSSVIGLIVISMGFGWRWWRERQAARFESECRELRRRQDWRQLELVSEKWSRDEPGRANAWLFRAEAAERQRKYVASAEFLFQVPVKDPKSLPAFMEGAKLLLGNANHPLEGVEALQKLLQREPRVADAHRHLIQFYALTMQRQLLLRQIRFAIQSDREPPEAYVYLFLVDTLRLSNGVELNNRWLEQYPDREIFVVARALHREEQREAEREASQDRKELDSKSSGPVSARSRELDELFTRFPQNIELLSHQIEQALRAGIVDQAIDLLSHAPPGIDDDSRFWRYKGQVHEAREQYAEAESAYRRAVEIAPMDRSSLNKLAGIERLQQNFTNADRLQRLVRQADALREKVRTYPTAEEVGQDWLRQLGEFAREAGDEFVANSLIHRLGSE